MMRGLIPVKVPVRRGGLMFMQTVWKAPVKLESPRKAEKQYEFNGLAGCVEQRKRKNGALVGVYNNAQAGLDDSGGELPWSSVCETHGNIIAHPSLKLAQFHAVTPEEWCDGCMGTDPRDQWGDDFDIQITPAEWQRNLETIADFESGSQISYNKGQTLLHGSEKDMAEFADAIRKQDPAFASKIDKMLADEGSGPQLTLPLETPKKPKPTYSQITFTDEDGKKKKTILKNPVPVKLAGVDCIGGLEITKEGDSTFDEGDRRRIIERSLISKEEPMVWNNHYAELEVVKPEPTPLKEHTTPTFTIPVRGKEPILTIGKQDALDHFAELRRRTLEAGDRNIRDAEGMESFRMETPLVPGMYYIVHPSAREPGRIQVTAFTKKDDQPWGHNTFDYREDAIRAYSGASGPWGPPYGDTGMRVVPS
jgi:hypothetical protein